MSESTLQKVGNKGIATFGIDRTQMLVETLTSLQEAQKAIMVAKRNRHFLFCFEDDKHPSNLGLTMQRLDFSLRAMTERVQKQLGKDPTVMARGLAVSEDLIRFRKQPGVTIDAEGQSSEGEI